MSKKFTDLSNKVIGCAIEVHRHVGPGLLESAYHQCLAHELTLQNIPFQMEQPMPVIYKGVRMKCGYRADFVIDNALIVELKAVKEVLPIHEAQILNYLKLAEIKQGLLINFNVTLLKKGLRSFVW